MPTKSSTKPTRGHTAKKTALNKKQRFNWKIAAMIGVVMVAALGYLYVRLSRAANYDGYQRLRVLQVASSQVGQREYSPQVLAYTEGHRERWCADFVSWVYMSAGYPFYTTPEAGRSSWRITLAWKKVAGKPNLRDYFSTQGTWQWGGRNGSYTPAPGDVIVFGDDESHTGIVEKVDFPANKEPQVSTIEGNVSDQVVRRNYSKTDASISGYGTIIGGGGSGAAYKF